MTANAGDNSVCMQAGGDVYMIRRGETWECETLDQGGNTTKIEVKNI